MAQAETDINHCPISEAVWGLIAEQFDGRYGHLVRRPPFRRVSSSTLSASPSVFRGGVRRLAQALGVSECAGFGIGTGRSRSCGPQKIVADQAKTSPTALAKVGSFLSDRDTSADVSTGAEESMWCLQRPRVQTEGTMERAALPGHQMESPARILRTLL